MRRTLLLLLVLVGCSNNSSKPIDAAPPQADAPATAAPDPMAYCTDIQAHCTGANGQYPSMDQCLGSTPSFPVGKTGDLSGNTLGCRATHAGALAMSDPATNCVYAGPGGDKTSVAAPGTCGDACTSFCNLEMNLCGSKDTPLPGITPQYQNQAACMTACAKFDNTHPYTLTSGGNSLACRLLHATNAALYTKLGNLTLINAHCSHTAEVPAANTPCVGTPTP